ncbi:centrosome-associated protein 350 [Protobothrops mucrosquamatus]|uniref:centrosome-associated protein 350 n=1 Tax=Protobothrops mucrosquamatus TaxID=103944 RepID=UPI000775F94C|nr:centrosome-associated protein 350 [Protobothrops mucrosquamatus]
MWSNKANEFPLHNPKFPQNRNSTRDLTTEWDAFSQTKTALQHIENKLEVAPISIAGLDSVMEKKPSISTTRKISRKECRSSSQNKESCFRKPLRVTTLDSNVSKNGHVEFRQPLASFRDSQWSPSCKPSCQLEAKRLKYKEAGNKAEGIGMIYDKGEPDLHGRDLKSSSSTDETVVRYLNDHPAINALQSSDVMNPTKLEEEKSEESRGDEYTKISPSSIIQNELKELQLVESSTSSASTSSAHRLDILKQHQHDDKLEKLKERIRKQWECPEELTTRGHDPEYSDHPITVAAPENIVTPKVRKVATAPMAPSYKGFNPSEAKIRTPDGKVWCEEEFLNLSRELCRDLEFQLAEEDLPAIKIPTERKEKKGHKPVRKTQKIAQLSSPYFKSDGANTISTTSWRDGQKLAKKILGPVPKLEQPNTQILSSDRSEKDKSIKSVSSAQITETDCNMPVVVKSLTKCPERSWSKIRAKNNLKKKDAAPHNGGLGNDRVNKDFLPVEIRGILDDLQLDSVVQDSERRNEECQNQESEPSPFSVSHSPSKKKSDKVPISEDTQFILKKRHYDADEVRQYILRQQEERKKRQSEEKKAQKEATEQKNKRLKELYKKQKEAVASKTKITSTSETVTKQLQETYSKLFLEQTLLENPALSVQEVQSKPGYQPSGESDKENKAQERPVSASSSSDMSLSEPPHPLVRDNTLEPLRIHPEKLNSVAQVPCSKSVLNGALFSQLLSLDNMGILQKDFESVTSSRRSHNTAMGSMSSTPQPFMSSTVQPTINHYKHKLDRIEALKATAASLSNRIESEAKKLAGAGINYEAAWDTERDLLQRDQGDTCWAKASSPPVREDDVFSARLQKMLATCNSHTTFDDNLPGVGNLNEFKKLPEMISPHTGALGLPGNNTSEGILGNLSQKQACPAGPENKPAVLNDSGSSLSEGLLSTGFLSEEEGEKSNNPSLKIAEALNEKEFCVADKTGFEPIKEFQKEAENYLPIFTQIRNGPKPWEELVKGSPHSVINIFTKSYQLCGKESEEHAGQGSSTHRPLLPAMSPPDSIASYEDEFISSQGSGTSMDKKSTPEHSGTSSTSLKGELASKKLPYGHQTMELTHHSSRSPSSGSSRASTSSKRRGRKEKTESLNGFPNASLREESKVSPGTDYGLEQAKHLLSSNTVSSREQEVNPDSDNSLEELSGHSLMSLPDKVRSPRTISSAQSPNIQKKMDPVGNTAEKHRSLNCPRNIASGSMLNPAFSDLNIGNNRTGTNIPNGSMRFSPAGLQHRMSAELNYLSTIEESVHQISDIERVRGISLAQQESVSLALILKSQQQRHERDLTLLKLKAEQELLENQRNLEEAKQKAAQAHAESLHHLAHSHQEAAETLQETTSKIATHQLETAMLTADAARQIREMTELARFQISDAVGNTAAPVATLFDQEQKHNSAFIKQLKLRNMNRKADSVTTPPGKEETNDSKHHDLHAFDSYSESSRSKAHYQSSSSSRQESPSSKEAKKLSHHEKPSSSIEEEAPTAMNDSLQNNSIPSVPDERDSTSIATEYSLKFDESMTEDEIEEQSFRSLLPSESHRRINLKKRSHQVYSDEEASPEKPTLSPIKELNLPFSGGQDSFSKFTMEMVRQYMREEEMRAAHQSSLLRLREKALKEKTKAELAWLEHQKRHLRDKGEDDKMPPIRKKQRGLLLKLQQEKAEIKRLQEASKAARKERQLILKQQEEIERIRQTTMKLQEKLKSSGENKEHRSEDDKKQTHSSSPQPTDAEAYSPSSISSSDTSSIMQKLKKMRRRMDEKHCSPVHYFFSVFTSHHWASLSVCFPNLHPKFQLYIYNQLVRFLTKREQKLMQRRQHAEELLQWKQRLDAEEAEIRQIEKQALAAWEKELHKTKANKKGAGDQKSDQKETASEEDSSMPPCSRLNSESSIPELSNLVVESAPSKVSEIQGKPGSLDHTLTEEIVYTQELESAVSPGKPSPCKSSGSLSKQESNKQTQKSGGKQLSSTKSQDISCSWSDESLSMTQSETTSDQSDIESRIWALKDEVRKKKSVVYRLKKEQKKRLKEKLKAQEASLIKQLETYDEFIKKTEEELNRDLETTPTAKPQIKTPSTATEKPKIKPPPLHRSETSKSWKSLTDSERSRGSLESIAEHIDVVPSSEQSVSVNTMKFTEAEIQSEKQSHTASAVLKTLRKSTAESDDLDSLLSSAILKDLGNTSKISPTSLNKTEDAVSYDPQATRSIVQETAESKELEVEIASQVSEISDASVFDLNQNNSVSLKTEVPPETELSEKDQFVLECISVQEIKEMPSKRFKVDESITSVKSSDRLGKDTLKGDSLISEKISICEEPSYSNDFEESFLRTDVSKSEIVLTEYQRDTFYASTLSFKQDTRSQGEKSLYTRPPGSESPSFGSDDEISECLSENSLSVADSIHSERLLELKSPTEFVKNKECGNVEKVPADDSDDSSSQASSFKASSEKQEDILLGFSIGDRVLVSNVQPGTLKFKGRTNFAKGFWAGVELDEPEGNNNGSYNGIQYFDCKEKHGIFAPSQKISHFPESFGNELDSNENSFFNRELDNQHKTNQKGLECLEEEKNKRNSNEKSPRESSALKGLIGAGDYVKFNKSSGYVAVINTVDEFDQETGGFDSPKSSKNDNGMLPSAISNIHKEDFAIEVGEILDSSFPEKWKQQSIWQEQIENRFSPTNLEKSATPLLDLLTKERSQLEAQLKVPSQEKEDLRDRQERVGLLADSLLQGFVKDTVSQFQQIKKARNEKIHFSNQELGAVQEKKLAANEQQRFLVVYELDDGEEVSSPDMCPRPESPVFGASGQEELAKRLAELELSREFLNVLGDDQDWFDEDFGLSSHTLPQNQAEESAVLPKIKLPKVSPKPFEEPLAVPYVAEEVEELVHAAAEKLWKCKELGHDLQALSNPRDMNESPQNDDIETVSKEIYKQAVFDLTREIFEEIFAEDPNLNQPLWMKPSRIISGYFRRVKDPSDLEEIKVFITTEVLKLLNLRKESNNKTDWQKMMKFGRKKKDRVDHILVQELHEEEAQWVNYDEDELYVKMQLADGIFEALIRETIDLLNQITEKQKLLLV